MAKRGKSNKSLIYELSKNKNITDISMWIIGIIFILSSIANTISGNWKHALLALFVFVIVLPPFDKYYRRYTHLRIQNYEKALLIIFVILAGYSIS